MKPPHLDHLEGVILLEEEIGKPPRFRTWTLDTRHPYPINCIVERESTADGTFLGERLWYWQHEERALTGQRIFRERPKPPPPAFKENPMFDELVIKKPLPFTFPPGYKPD